MAISQDDQIATAQRIFLMIKQQPAIKEPLKRIGYTDSKLERDEQICAAAALAIAKQDTAAMEKAKATEKVERLRAEAEDKYSSLAATVRIVFPDDHALHQRLRLLGSPSQQRSQNAFLGNAHALYDGVIHQPDLLPPLEEAGYSAVRLADERAALDQLQEADAEQETAKLRSKTATAEQEKALAELRSRRSRFGKLAKLALKDNPQALAALGLH